MKKLMDKNMTNIMKDRLTHFDHFEDMLISGQETKAIKQQTYYNQLNELFSNNDYIDAPSNMDEVDVRRNALEIMFKQRVRFIMGQKVLFMNNYLEQYNLPLYIHHIEFDLEKEVPELFNLHFYVNAMTNPISGADYAMVINTYVYNSLMNNTSIRNNYDNSINVPEMISMINNFMKITVLEWHHMLNALFLEANEIYLNAGNPICKASSDEHCQVLEGEERTRALIEMGRPDLINSDTQVGRF